MQTDGKIIPLTMPKWGMAMTSGKVIEWLKEEGEKIQKGDELLEVETEKTVNAVEANDAGILSGLLVQPGEALPVGALLAVIAEEGVEKERIDAFVVEFQHNFIPETNPEETETGPLMLALEDITIAYRQIPSRHGQNNSPLVLIHGFGGDQKSWLFNIDALSAEHTVYTVDLPGHGQSSKQVRKGTIADLATVISEWMSKLELQPAHVVGHSLGAAIAIELPAQQQISSLTLISGIGAGTELDRQYIEDFIAASRRREIKHCLQQLFADARHLNRDMVENMLKVKRIETVDTCLRKIADAAIIDVDCKAEPALSQLETPVQVIWGREDRIAGSGQVKKLPESIPVKIFDNAGHMVHMEAANKVNAAITEFTTLAESSS